MINVLMVVPNRADATSLYRSMGPFSEMRRQRDFNMIFSPTADWSIVRMVDCIFMQRPFNGDHLRLAELAKQWGVPLWVDYDDLLFDIPTDNPAYPIYMSEEARTNLVKIIKAATVVTVSTEQLKRCLQLEKECLNDRVFVVENGLLNCFIPKRMPRGERPLVTWRGSNTHQRDVFGYADPIAHFLQKRKNVTINFIGGWNPFFLTDRIPDPQAIVAPAMDIGAYFDYLTAVNPYAHIVPLDHSLFNLCKSNIAWIEATLAGAVCLAPAWPEWQKPGIVGFNSQGSLLKALEQVFDSPQEMAQAHEDSWHYIAQNLLVSQINQKRLAILEALHLEARGRRASWEMIGHGGRLPDPQSATKEISK